MALVMKLHFSNRKERSKIRAVLTVVAVLVIGVLAKLGATMQLFQLPLISGISGNHTPDAGS
jgi:hypothetical protein